MPSDIGHITFLSWAHIDLLLIASIVCQTTTHVVFSVAISSDSQGIETRAQIDGEVIVLTTALQKHITCPTSLGRYSEEPRVSEGKLNSSAIVANADLFESLHKIQ